jgi:hypothetical protein
VSFPERQYKPEFREVEAELRGGKARKPRQQDIASVKDLAIAITDEKKRTIEQIDQVEPQKPLTQEEAEAIQQDVATLLDKATRVKRKVGYLAKTVDEAVEAYNPAMTIFRYDLSKRPRLKKAMKAIFGSSRPTISYSDYLQALRIKREMEEKEGKAVFEEDNFDD